VEAVKRVTRLLLTSTDRVQSIDERPESSGVKKQLRFLAPVAAAIIALSACGNTSSPTPKKAVPTTVASQPASPATKVASSVVAKANGATPVTTTGDADLDEADAELKAFENESAGLDQAANATQETK
jgi:hypothetical protein